MLTRLEVCRSPDASLLEWRGPRVAAASPIHVEIVRKQKGQVGFTVHARRWVVERFFAWINLMEITTGVILSLAPTGICI